MASLYKTTFTTRYGKDFVEPVSLTIKVRRDEYNACYVSVFYHGSGKHHRTIKSYPEAIATDIAKKSAAIAKKDNYPTLDKHGTYSYRQYDPESDIGL